MFSLPSPAILAAATGGLLWTFKVAVITARDGSFDPLESWVFIGGLLALAAAAVLVALHLTRRLRGVARVAVTIVAALGLIAATLVLESIGKALVGGLSDGGNLGLEEEGGILLAGLTWLAVAASAAVTRLRGASERRAADPSDRGVAGVGR